MNKVIFSACLVAVVGAANAQSFYDSVFTMSHPTATSTETALGRKIWRTLSGFDLGGGEAQSAAWTFKFDAAPGAFNGVRLTIRGTADSVAAVKVIGTEEVFDISGGGSTSVGSGLIDYDHTSGGSWVATMDIPFTGDVSNGFASKDILFVNLGVGSFKVDSIEQEFTAVPEPASMAVLALGLGALIRRRK